MHTWRAMSCSYAIRAFASLKVRLFIDANCIHRVETWTRVLDAPADVEVIDVLEESTIFEIICYTFDP